MPRQVYLPKGPPGWYDFYSEQYHEAGATITAAAPLDRIPLFLPAGEGLQRLLWSLEPASCRGVPAS